MKRILSFVIVLMFSIFAFPGCGAISKYQEVKEAIREARGVAEKTAGEASGAARTAGSKARETAKSVGGAIKRGAKGLGDQIRGFAPPNNLTADPGPFASATEAEAEALNAHWLSAGRQKRIAEAREKYDEAFPSEKLELEGKESSPCVRLAAARKFLALLQGWEAEVSIRAQVRSENGFVWKDQLETRSFEPLLLTEVSQMGEDAVKAEYAKLKDDCAPKSAKRR